MGNFVSFSVATLDGIVFFLSHDFPVSLSLSLSDRLFPDVGDDDDEDVFTFSK